MKKIILLISIVLIMSSVYAEGFKIVANKDIDITAISEDLLKNIYLGKKSQLDDGTKIEAVMEESGDEIEEFVKNIVGKTLSQFKTFWKKAIFTGKGKPPRSFKNSKEVIEFVKSNPGTIGLISGEVDDSVKVIEIQK